MPHGIECQCVVEKWTLCMNDWWNGKKSTVSQVMTNFQLFVLIKISCIQHW